VGQFRPNFHVVGDAPREPLHGYIVRSVNAYNSLTVYTQRNFVADFLQVKCSFIVIENVLDQLTRILLHYYPISQEAIKGVLERLLERTMKVFMIHGMLTYRWS